MSPPPLPSGWKIWTHPVSQEMRRWAVAIDNDPVGYPMWSTTSAVFDGVLVGARVEVHTWTFRNGVKVSGIFRGVTLYDTGGAIVAPPEPPAVVEGVDVSAYQGAIDWSAVAAAGKRFAIVRVSDGARHSDPWFSKHWDGAAAAGLDLGCYQYFRASQDPLEQAHLLLAAMPRGSAIAPTVDVETLDGCSPADVVARVGAWLDCVASELGERPMVYTSPGFWARLSGVGVDAEKASLWVAHWKVAKPTVPAGWPAWDIWQYAADGRVPGIAGPCDLDRMRAPDVVQVHDPVTDEIVGEIVDGTLTPEINTIDTDPAPAPDDTEAA